MTTTSKENYSDILESISKDIYITINLLELKTILSNVQSITQESNIGNNKTKDLIGEISDNFYMLKLKTLEKAKIDPLGGGSLDQILDVSTQSTVSFREDAQNIIKSAAKAVLDVNLEDIKAAQQEAIQQKALLGEEKKLKLNDINKLNVLINEKNNNIIDLFEKKKEEAKLQHEDLMGKFDEYKSQIENDKKKANDQIWWSNFLQISLSLILSGILVYFLSQSSENLIELIYNFINGTLNASLTGILTVTNALNPSNWKWWGSNDDQPKAEVNNEKTIATEDEKSQALSAITSVLHFILTIIFTFVFLICHRIIGLVTGKNQLTAADSQKNMLSRALSVLPGSKIAEGAVNLSALFPILILIGFPKSEKTLGLEKKAEMNQQHILSHVKSLLAEDNTISKFIDENNEILTKVQIEELFKTQLEKDPGFLQQKIIIDGLMNQLEENKSSLTVLNNELKEVTAAQRAAREAITGRFNGESMKVTQQLLKMLTEAHNSLQFSQNSTQALHPPGMRALPPGLDTATGGNRKKSKKRKNKKHKNKSKSKNKNKSKSKKSKKKKKNKKTHRK